MSGTGAEAEPHAEALGSALKEARALIEELRQTLADQLGALLDAERLQHVFTRQELIETRELLRELFREAKRGVPDESYPYRDLWQRIEAVLAAPVAEMPDGWAKPADQPATGPLRMKLGVARGVLMTVLQSTTIGGPPLPTQAELRQAIEATADP